MFRLLRFINFYLSLIKIFQELTKNMNFFQNISRLLKAEVRDIRRKFLKLMNIATPMNPGLIDIIYTNKIHEDLLPICLKDDISVKTSICIIKVDINIGSKRSI